MTPEQWNDLAPGDCLFLRPEDATFRSNLGKVLLVSTVPIGLADLTLFYITGRRVDEVQANVWFQGIKFDGSGTILAHDADVYDEERWEVFRLADPIWDPGRRQWDCRVGHIMQHSLRRRLFKVLSRRPAERSALGRQTYRLQEIGGNGQGDMNGLLANRRNWTPSTPDYPFSISAQANALYENLAMGDRRRRQNEADGRRTTRTIRQTAEEPGLVDWRSVNEEQASRGPEFSAVEATLEGDAVRSFVVGQIDVPGYEQGGEKVDSRLQDKIDNAVRAILAEPGSPYEYVHKAVSMWANEVAFLSEVLKEEADSHDLCDQFEKVLRKVNPALTFPLGERVRRHSLEVRGTLTFSAEGPIDSEAVLRELRKAWFNMGEDYVDAVFAWATLASEN